MIDVNVGFAGRDETKDMNAVMGMYNQKIALPLMPDSTQTTGLETALKNIGGKPVFSLFGIPHCIEVDCRCDLPSIVFGRRVKDDR